MSNLFITEKLYVFRRDISFEAAQYVGHQAYAQADNLAVAVDYIYAEIADLVLTEMNKRVE